MTFQKSFSGREWCSLVEGEVEFEDINPGLTEKAELTALGVLRNESSDGIFPEAALARDARDLELRCGGGDVGIEPGTRSGDQVDRNIGIGVVELKDANVSGDAINQFLVCGTVVGA